MRPRSGDFARFGSYLRGFQRFYKRFSFQHTGVRAADAQVHKHALQDHDQRVLVWSDEGSGSSRGGGGGGGNDDARLVGNAMARHGSTKSNAGEARGHVTADTSAYDNAARRSRAYANFGHVAEDEVAFVTRGLQLVRRKRAPCPGTRWS